MPATERQKRNYRICVDTGLCCDCKQPRGINGTRTLCRKCAQQHRKNTAEWTKRRLALGLCLRCGKPNDNPKSKYGCVVCGIFVAEAARESRRRSQEAAHPRYCQSCNYAVLIGKQRKWCVLCARKVVCTEQKVLRDQRRARGLCTRCGAARGAEGTGMRCRACADDAAASERNRKARRTPCDIGAGI